jgi:hypothetical protein
LDVRASDEANEDDINEFSPSSALSAMARIRLHVLNHGHQLPETWERAVGSARAASRQAAESNLRLMESLLVERDEVGETLAKLYRSTSARWPVDVTKVCGGCPADRLIPERQPMYRVPLAVALRDVQEPDVTAWRTNFPWLDPGFVCVFYDESNPETTRDILRLLLWLVRECDLQELGVQAGSPLAQMHEVRSLYRSSGRKMLVHRDLSQHSDEPYSPLFRVSIIEAADPHALEHMRALQRPNHIVLLPANTRDPENPDRRLQETMTAAISLDTMIPVLTA